MTYIIIVFGALILIAGTTLIINPELVFGFLRRNTNSIGLHITAVVVRAILGALLIIYAAQSKFPMIILVLGWIAVAAAVALAVIGRRNFISLMAWLLNFANSFGRVGGLLGMLFGAFLVYAFV